MARRGGLFSAQFTGLKELAAEFKQMEKKFDQEAQKGYSKYSMLVEEGTKALAPHDEGDLEDTISSSKVQRKGSGYEFESGSNSKYALVRHYAPYRYGVHDKVSNGAVFKNYYVYGRGRRTLSKPSWRGEKPGRLYLERAIRVTEKDYDKTNEMILQNTLRRRKGGRK